jgi:hypothetical protein
MAFVTDSAFDTSTSRLSLWQQWDVALQAFTGAVTTYAAWISGSFVTDKVNPRDIDAVFLISGEDRAARGVQDRQIVESFVLRVKDPLTGRLLPRHRLGVDSYVVEWEPHQMTAGSAKLSPPYAEYAADRGYWDDWWSRRRVTPKGQPPQRPDALPQRGYLEVSLNAFA